MKILKIVAITLGVFLLLGISAMILAVILIDPNDYKERISVAVKDSSGAELQIEGDIGLSVFPWLGLELGKVTINNAQGYGEPLFGQVDGLQIRVALLPLFKAKVEIDQITLDGLRLNLERKDTGKANWEELATVEVETTPAPEPAPTSAETAEEEMPEIVIGGVQISNAHIQWVDGQAGSRSSIEKFNLSTGKITLTDPINFKTDFTVNNSEPKIQVEIILSGEIAFDLKAEQYGINNLKLNSVLSGDTIPNAKQTLIINTSVKADLKQQTATIDPLNIEFLGLTINTRLDATQIQGDAQANGEFSIAPFSPRQLMAMMGTDVPDTADKTVLQKMQVSMNFSGSTTEAALTDIKLVLDDTNVTGNVNVKNLNENPALRIKLAIDAIDADRYLSPVLETDAAASPEVVASTGDEPIELPMETLRELDAVGGLTIGAFKMMNLTMKQFDAQLLAKDGVVTFKPLNVDLYEGFFRGDAVIDARKDKPEFTMNIKLADVSSMILLADYLQDKSFVSGRMNLNADISTQGDTVNALKKALNGQMDFLFKDGALQGVNINEKINEARAFVKGESYTRKNTEKATSFGSLNGQADITNGVVNQKVFQLNAPPRIQASGQGTADLNTDKLDYRLSVSYYDNPEDTKPKTLPLKIKGTFDAPDVSIDLSGMRKAAVDEKKEELKEEAKQQVDEATDKAKDKLKDKLKKKLKL